MLACRKRDQPLGESCSFFIPEDVVVDMAQEVENERCAHSNHPLADDQDAVLPGLQLPNHVFDGCTDSFFATKESNQKPDSSTFSDTGLMVLVCHHDRVIFMVNLHDAGEKQHNALVMIKQLFLELPAVWNVGILYDIGCQLHKALPR